MWSACNLCRCRRCSLSRRGSFLLSKVGTDLSNIRSGILAQAITDGDEVILTIVRQAAHWLGVGVASVVNLLAPDIVVLGGGLVEALPNLYLETVEEAARNRVMDSFRDGFKVRVAELGDDASVLGAAAWARTCVTGA